MLLSVEEKNWSNEEETSLQCDCNHPSSEDDTRRSVDQPSTCDGALLMNLCGPCPGDELATECELSPRGEGANKTQHNTNEPLGLCEPTGQDSRPSGWAL